MHFLLENEYKKLHFKTKHFVKDSNIMGAGHDLLAWFMKFQP